MNRYRYAVRDKYGREMKGDLVAADQDEALQLLQGSGLYVTALEAITQPLRFLNVHRSRAPDDQKIFLLESWTMFLEAGFSVQAALLRIRNITRDRAILRALQSVQSSMDRGVKLSEALAASRLFPLSWVGVLTVGEKIGDFVGPLRSMRHQIIRLRRLREGALRMLLMPCILVTLSLVWFWIFLRTVVPAMLKFSADMGAPVPLLQTISSMSDVLFYGSQALVALTAVVALIFLRFNRANQVMGNFQTWMPTRVPVFGPIAATLHLMVVASELRLQLEAGIPLETALHTLSLSTPNREVRRELFRACSRIQEGVPAGEAVAGLNFIPMDKKMLILAGDAGAQLPKALDLLVKFSQEELHFKVKILTTLLQNGAVLACGLLVGLLAAAYFGLWLVTYSTLMDAPNSPLFVVE